MPVCSPNLFIVGAAKCGTTSMHEYLSQHPEIFMAPDKELKYFMFPLQIHPPVKNASAFSSYMRYVAKRNIENINANDVVNTLYLLKVTK